MILDRRRSFRRPPLAAPFGYRVEAVAPAALEGQVAEWRDLCARAVEPNVFFDANFLLPAYRHIERRASARIVVIRRNIDGRWRIVGLCPLSPPRVGVAQIARVWRHPQTALSAPLFDKRYFKGAFDALLYWLGREYPALGALVLPQLPLDGPVARMMGGRAQRLGAQKRLLDAHERAILTQDSPATGFSRKGLRNLERLRRRLAEQGETTFDCATDAEAMTAFLALEASGWKGARATALGNTPELANFARDVAGRFAAEKALRIYSLKFDGRPIAMGVVLIGGGAAIFWKMAYDESFAAFSPGVLLGLEMTQALAADPTIAAVDSCAIAGHAMMERLWPRRMRVGDAVISARPNAGASFNLAYARERVARNLRALAKTAYLRLKPERR